MNASLPAMLRRFRTRIGVTLQDAGESAGRTKQAIAAYERGVAKPPPEVLKALAKRYRLAGDEAFTLFDSAGYVVRFVVGGDTEAA